MVDRFSISRREQTVYRAKQPSIHAVALAAAMMALVTSPGSRAEEPTTPMVLGAVMKQLGRDMQAVTGAISREDWSRVEDLAPKLVRRDEPPFTEKMRILARLGTDLGKFRSFDTQVHDAANSMGDAAMRGDGLAVINAFARVQQACLGCHQGFRKSFMEHFQTKR
ncbi:MAG: cytochrome c [Burkholderiaceae bacterium]|nr:cytochrome c [Burkholderiaceae bacterium]